MQQKFKKKKNVTTNREFFFLSLELRPASDVLDLLFSFHKDILFI